MNKEEKKVKEKINQLHKVFQQSMTYPKSMIWEQVIDFNIHQWNDIEPSIKKALEFIEKYRYKNEWRNIKSQDYGDQRQYIEIYAVACLPFLLAEFRIENPDIPDKRMRKTTLDWLLYIKQNKPMAMHLIHEITSDDSISNIQDDRLDEQIRVYRWFVDEANKTIKKTNWSRVLQFQYLAHSLDVIWKLDKTKDFLYQFFSEFGENYDDEINHDVIEKSIINEARANPLINVSKEHIEKVLSLPNNKHTELDIREKFHYNLAKALM